MTGRRHVGLWAPVVAIMGTLFYLSSQPSVPGGGLLWDKAAHAAAFLTLGLFCLRAIHGGIVSASARGVVLALTLALAYGVVDELRQRSVPGRDASVPDWIADAVGAGLAVPLFETIARRRRRTHQPPQRRNDGTQDRHPAR